MMNTTASHDLDLLGEYDEFELIDLSDTETGAWGWAVITASTWVCAVGYTVFGPTTACSGQC